LFGSRVAASREGMTTRASGEFALEIIVFP
jgi:hypothetical protein